MSKFLREILFLFATFSLALISGNLIYRFYLIPQSENGEIAGFFFGISVLPVIFGLLFWGTRADTWKKLLLFALIITILILSYLRMIKWLEFSGTEQLENNSNGFFQIVWGILTMTGFFYIILGIVRVVFLGFRTILKRVLPERI